MAQKIQFSAQFKRDYVAASAVIIFILIVIGEVFLAISIPLYLHREDTMAREVRRLRLQETFDSTRNKIENLKLKNETADAEAKLVSWNLNLMADYLRDYVDVLTDEEITETQKAVNEMSATINSLAQGKVFSEESNLDTTVYIDNLLNRMEKKYNDNTVK